MFVNTLHRALILTSLVGVVSSQSLASTATDAGLVASAVRTATTTIALPADIPIESVDQNDTTLIDESDDTLEDPLIDPSTLRTVPLLRSLFEIRDRVTERKRQAFDIPYTMTYSHDVVEGSNASRLYAVDASRAVVDEVLQNAVAVAGAQDPTEFRLSFNTSTDNLTLIMNAVASTPTRPTLNWRAYEAIAGILLNDTVRPGDRTQSWVGVVKDPSGTLTAEVAIIPSVIMAERGAESASDPSLGRRSRLAKRVGQESTRLIRNLRDYSLAYTRVRAVPVPGATLVAVMDEVVTTTYAHRRSMTYTEYFHRDQEGLNYDSAGGNNGRGPSGPHTFAFRMTPGNRVSREQMLLIIREIHLIARRHIQRYAPNAFGIDGRLLYRGAVVGHWSLGGRPRIPNVEAATCPREQRAPVAPVGPLPVRFFEAIAARACMRP
ncbi:MAG: hypothetical protein M1817_006357 [Caeruleum heppii]|nr:MAG: hypothetical protein M1817_006357 [Caeruleum heppii]